MLFPLLVNDWPPAGVAILAWAAERFAELGAEQWYGVRMPR